MLTEKFNQDFVALYYVEIIQVMELKLSAYGSSNVRNYDLRQIPNKILRMFTGHSFKLQRLMNFLNRPNRGFLSCFMTLFASDKKFKPE